MTEERRYLPYSNDCFVCGTDNRAGLNLRFFVEGDTVKAHVAVEPHHCGYAGVVHGGVVAAMLDECMAWAANRALQRMCVTAELTVRYLENVPDAVPLTLETEVRKANRMMAVTEGRIVGEDDTVYARATAKFLPLSKEETLDIDERLVYDGHEERVFDGLRD